MAKKLKIGVIGLGYVGLPVAVSFALNGWGVVAYDVDETRVCQIKDGFDRTCEVSSHELRQAKMHVTSDPSSLSSVDFYIVTVPTPIDDKRQPDLTSLLAASATIGKTLQTGNIVVYESTVYPGATEEDCGPVLEQESGLVCGKDFTLGYSPERINPGDKKHRFEEITKVVAGQDTNTLNVVSKVYGSVVKAGIHEAPSIKTAEAAKILENTQRDINIALMNEMSHICRIMGIDTHSVLAAARTKWNFLDFRPGLVGGHCIGVDPYYLTHKAQLEGYRPEMILAGRNINDNMGISVARHLMELMECGDPANRKISVLGLTFKPNVPDIRNSKVFDLIAELQSQNHIVNVFDPVADPSEVLDLHGLSLQGIKELEPADAIVLAVGHELFAAGGWDLIVPLLKNGSGIVVDLFATLDVNNKPEDITLLRL